MESESPRRGILVTRPLADALRITGSIEARGFTPVIAPLLQVRTLFPEVPHDVQAVLVTSANALDPVSAWDVKLFAVGDATAARARTIGFEDVTSASGDAAALVALVTEKLHQDAGPLLLLSGAGQGGAVCEGLRHAGFRVIRRVTYAATPVRLLPQAATDALEHGDLHAAIFLSAETASTFVRLLPESSVHNVQGVVAVAIGKAAADALKPLPWREVRLAATPTLDDVLALL
jgi:uroporphyrinogen-III synthase